MKKLFLFVVFSLAIWSTIYAQTDKKDTVYTGIYITSIHNIDFKQNEFTITFWLWMKYKNPELDFVNNLEVPNAKTVDKTFATLDTSENGIVLQMKMQCVMKDSWQINNFPFDEQKLRVSIENSQYDTSTMIFVADTLGEHYDKRFTLHGWYIDSCIISTGNKVYKTVFGDDTAVEQESVYSAFRVRLSVTREAGELFLKMFLGMYLAFFVSYICFFIHSDSMDSRFSLSVGSLFAVVGNKYIIESSLPESSSFTLVDTLHGITLLFILLVIAANTYSLRMVKKGQYEKAFYFDNRIGLLVLISYLLLNTFFIWQAVLA